MSVKDPKGVEDFSVFSALSSCITLGCEDDKKCLSVLKVHQRISECRRCWPGSDRVSSQRGSLDNQGQVRDSPNIEGVLCLKVSLDGNGPMMIRVPGQRGSQNDKGSMPERVPVHRASPVIEGPWAEKAPE